MRAAVFVDSCHWIALLNRRDALHRTAVLAQGKLGSRSLVTTGLVLTEVLNFFAGRPAVLRREAGSFVRLLIGRTEIEVAPLSDAWFSAAVDLYIDRQDKGWSLTDCYSFVLMERQGIADALTNDHHFEQAGFKALLKT